MANLSINKLTTGTVNDVCAKVTEAIKPIGFGVLTRIDFDQKIQEKLNQKINPCVILGACNPHIAYAAYQQTTDVALLIPCNIVVREIGTDKIQIEAMRPSQMLNFLSGISQSPELEKAEKDLERVILSI